MCVKLTWTLCKDLMKVTSLREQQKNHHIEVWNEIFA